MSAALRKNALSCLGGIFLLLALLAAYANHFQNSFHFDDAHTIVNNAAIQDLRSVPLFFRDATTFSSLPSNQSYRPLVSTLLAIDYWLGGGLHPFCFHVSIFALFIALALLLAFVIHRLLDGLAISARNGWIALAAAACYGLHPANADTVNYIVASADVISTLGVVASFAIYLGFPNLRRYYLFVLPAAIAILAKPPAAIFAVLFALYRLLFPPSSQGPVSPPDLARAWPETEAPVEGDTLRPPSPSDGGATWSVAAKACFKEIIPPFLICAAVMLFVQVMTPPTWVAGAANAHRYLITQPYVAWLYFTTFLWPNALSADYDLSPFSTTNDVRAFSDVLMVGRFWAGVAFAVLITAMAIAAAVFRRTRVIGFGLLWFLIALLPTSLLPLAEVMNDHRTFLPYIGLVIAAAGAAAWLIDCRGSGLLPEGRELRKLSRAGSLPLQNREARRGLPVRMAGLGAVALFLCASGYATFQRNKVWRTEETLWHDVTIKSPRNGRGLMNYGNTLMARGDYAGALDYFHRAQVFTPRYPVLLINLAIAEDATKQSAVAEQHFKEAMRLAPATPDSYTYYARFLLDHSRTSAARTLLQSALALSPGDLTARDLLARADQQTDQRPVAATPESYLDLSLQLYRDGRFAESIEASRRALALRPGYAEAWNNIGAAYNKLGQFDQGAAACEQALRDKPDFELARNNLRYAQEMKAREGKK